MLYHNTSSMLKWLFYHRIFTKLRDNTASGFIPNTINRQKLTANIELYASILLQTHTFWRVKPSPELGQWCNKLCLSQQQLMMLSPLVLGAEPLIIYALKNRKIDYSYLPFYDKYSFRSFIFLLFYFLIKTIL